MKGGLLALLIAGAAYGGVLSVGNSISQVVTDINGQAITPASVSATTISASTLTSSTISASTVTLSLSGASSSAFPYSPLQIYGNANTFLQAVMQNFSNGTNASSDLVLTNDLGANTSFYFEIGINSSKFSQSGQSVEASSSAFVISSDSDLVIWAGTNGGLNSAVNERLIFGSSNPVSANTAAIIQPATASAPGALTVFSSATFKATGTGTTPAATFSPNLSSNTVSGALSGTFTNTTLGVCISTITLTLPVNGGAVFLGFNGAISVNGLAAVIGIGVLVDGAFVNGESASKGLTAPVEPVISNAVNMSFSAPVTGLSVATHNFCLSPFVSTGTGTIDSTNSVAKFWAFALP